MAFVGAWVQAQCWMRNAFKQLNSYLMTTRSCNYFCEILLHFVFLLNWAQILDWIWVQPAQRLPEHPLTPRLGPSHSAAADNEGEGLVPLFGQESDLFCVAQRRREQ